jgi:hypothetical protein
VKVVKAFLERLKASVAGRGVSAACLGPAIFIYLAFHRNTSGHNNSISFSMSKGNT